MTLYKDQLSTLVPFEEFISEYKTNLAYNAMQALLEYEGTLSVDYEDYVVIFVESNNKNEAIFAVSKIIDFWKPVEINDRVRKFTEKRVFPYDSHAHIKFD